MYYCGSGIYVETGVDGPSSNFIIDSFTFAVTSLRKAFFFLTQMSVIYQGTLGTLKCAGK